MAPPATHAAPPAAPPPAVVGLPAARVDELPQQHTLPLLSFRTPMNPRQTPSRDLLDASPTSFQVLDTFTTPLPTPKFTPAASRMASPGPVPHSMPPSPSNFLALEASIERLLQSTIDMVQTARPEPEPAAPPPPDARARVCGVMDGGGRG